MPLAGIRETNDPQNESPSCIDLSYLHQIMGIPASSDDGFIESLPFSSGDTTAGTENELQVVVLGNRKDLDLAITIEESNYYKNLIRRAARGDTSKKTILELESYLSQEKDNVWENSWVRFPRRVLNSYSNNIFNADLKSDKANPASGPRSDASRFTFIKNSEEFLRIPVSYLLKLSLADIVGSGSEIHTLIRITGEQMLAHFSNDNTSPELFSFFPVRAAGSKSMGQELAKETLFRFLSKF